MSHPELLSIDPATGEEVWRGPAASEADVDAAVAKARAAQPAWERTPSADRRDVLQRYQNAVRDRADELARIISRETGKPLWETNGEVQATQAKVDISITAYQERTGSREKEGDQFRQALRHRAHGVLAVLGPYNFPAHLPNGHIVPGLLAGNAMVFKPSELTPATAEFMKECWTEAGLPDGCLQIVQGAGETGRALAGHAGINGLLFTGSARTGHALARQFAETPGKILALEMGGNNPLVCWDIAQANAEDAAALVAQSAFLSAGQRCTNARRLIVEERSHEALLEALVELSGDLIVGAPFDDPQPFMGPVISNAAADTLQEQYRGLVAAGAREIVPLTRPDPSLPFLTPAILDVTSVVDRPDEEMFGPVLQVVRVPHFNAAVAEANATRFGLSAGLIASDAELYERFRREIRAGIVNWNRPTNGASSAAPFGGIGDSGNHRPSAYYAADYCAYPVASLEHDRISGDIGLGRKSLQTTEPE
ncbi:succinylglutamate-semialdehyde dehydrogenase [Pacificimonas flava]|uniref:Succinylglutamate-semialdehyde dehydrogenase n=2 Tax=Pacificimonas TaxID=1960290 RepID=A0A219B3N7_9SPHN|nr:MULTISPECIES: succinylglutamate-semialdehyde dehydrogenase [Pacificimonas]MBZ6377337.1 succinylglutamate-semialdehyde dehydrogenase [Pacificimonas aurantium]OWV32955.1 succinylglutamate-semialdehyde dehydrogenase [Pacificimonas flava]